MTLDFAKPKLSVDQKKRIKKLYARNNYRGFLAILSDYGWIAFACWLSLAVHPAFYIPTILLIGARQRALASLLREAAHGTLLRSKILNISVGRILCGWPILQSFDTYRTSHVLAHHPKIGDLKEDPDYQYMKDCGIYEPQSRTKFINRFVVSPLFGSLTPRYVRFLIRDRFMSALMRRSERREAMAIIAFHLAICIFASWGGWLLELALYWWVPFILVYPIIGWFSELSEHYPLMEQASGKQYFSRNRYAGWLERLFIGMHGDHLHLTHHLLPGIPHWNLSLATQILREDPAFRAWDDYWGGIFSSNRPNRVSLIRYIMTNQQHEWPDRLPSLLS